ncbi:MAG TPA: hypothetical protein VER58_20445 [Thermoanaerobaculia bacterium]|nr:hypothetical protein [Thermoanaerobaculia bacterium]
MPHTIPLVKGHTVRWKWTEGPTAGKTYDHTFENDGSVVFREVQAGSAQGNGTRVKKYASFEVAPDVELVSYLGDHGFTLTVAMNYDTGKIYGIASNDKQWFPVAGTFEVVK